VHGLGLDTVSTQYYNVSSRFRLGLGYFVSLVETFRAAMRRNAASHYRPSCHIQYKAICPSSPQFV